MIETTEAIEGYRLPRAAEMLGLHVDDLMQLAQAGKVRLCIKGGGRSFSAFVEGPIGTVPGEYSVRPAGLFQVQGDMYVDPLDINTVLATGRAKLGCSLYDCDDQSRFFIPSGGFGTMTIHADDLWMRQIDMPAAPPPTLESDHKETSDERGRRRLDLLKLQFGGKVVALKGGWRIEGDRAFTRLLEHLSQKGEKAISPKTVRLDLVKAEIALRSARKSSVFPISTSR